MSGELQNENSADDKARTPLGFVETREDEDSVQAQSLQSVNEESVKTPESAEKKLAETLNQEVQDNKVSPDNEDLSPPPPGPTEEKPSDEDHRRKSTQDIPIVDLITINERGDTSDLSLPREESILSEVLSSDGDRHHRLDLETPDPRPSSSSSSYDTSCEEYTLLLEQLTQEGAQATEHTKQLQTKLAAYFSKKTGEDSVMGRLLQGSEKTEKKSYDSCLRELTELKQQLQEETERAERQTEELRLQAQEKLSKVDKEWHDLMSLKKDMTVMVLSRRMSKPDALAKVESILAAEQSRQEQLTKLRLQNFRLKTRIRKLEMELREVDARASNPLQLRYEQLLAQRLESKKYMDKQNEEALKMKKKMVWSLELLSNIKEKLHWTETEVQDKREQLSRVDTSVATKREELSVVKQARNSLQRDNVKLKERRGLLGNEVLLRDFDHTTEACAELEEKLQRLKSRHADLDFYLGRGKKKVETLLQERI